MFTEDMFDDFVETTFIFQFVSNVTVENMHFFSELADWLTSAAWLCTFEIVAPKIRLCKKILNTDFAKLRKKMEAVAFYHFGTLQLLLLKCKQTPKWKKQRQSTMLVDARNKICFLFALTFTAVLLSCEKMTETN